MASKESSRAGFTGVLFGAVTGFLLGSGFGAWEALAMALYGFEGGPADAPLPSMLATGLVGTGAGALAGGTGLKRYGWMIATAVGTLGWLTLGLVHECMVALDVTPAATCAAFGLLMMLLGTLLGRMRLPDRIGQFVSLLALISGALVLPIWIHITPMLPNPLSILMGGCAVGGAGMVSVLFGKLVGRAPPLVLLLVWGLSGSALWFLITLLPTRVPPTPDAGKTGVVVVTIEGLRADAMTSETYRTATSNLRKLARRANASGATVAGSAQPAAALATLWTASPVTVHGVGYSTPRGSVNDVLPQDATTLFGVLQVAGFQTVGVTGSSWLERNGFARPFDTWLSHGRGGATPAVAHFVEQRYPNTTRWPLRHSVEDVVDRSIAFMGGAGDMAGLAMWVHLEHLRPPFPYRLEDKAAVGGQIADTQGAYRAALRRVDHALGRLVEEVPVGTLLVVAGVTGADLSGPTQRPADLPGRGGEGSLVNELLATPYVLVSGDPNGVSNSPYSAEGIAPQLIRTRGLPMPESWSDAADDLSDRSARSGGAPGGTRAQAVQNEGHKLVEDENGRWAIYDLNEDPDEQRPIRRGGAGVERIRKRLSGRMVPFNMTPRLQANRSVTRDASILFRRLLGTQREVYELR